MNNLSQYNKDNVPLPVILNEHQEVHFLSNHKIKDKKYMIILIDAENILDNMQHVLMS